MKDFKKIICVLIALWQTFMLISCGKEPIEMVNIPGKDYKMSTTEITQKFYESVMGENPSKFKGENNPVESTSWYDAIYFCNKLSEKCGYTPVYSVGGTTDVTKWNYTPHQKDSIYKDITQNTKADGFRLPTNAEWEYAAKGGQNYEYAGSNNIDEVAWYDKNSNGTTHPVAQKKANGYGLYDMSGNVEEWCGDDAFEGFRHLRIGGWDSSEFNCMFSFNMGCDLAHSPLNDNTGFRVVRTAKEEVGRSLKHTQKVSIQEAVNILETLPNEPIKLIVIDELNDETIEKFVTFLDLLKNENIKVSLDLSKLKVSADFSKKVIKEITWFTKSKGLISVILPNWITGINSFFECINLTSVTIPDSVTSIGPEAFAKCESLTSIKLPDSVTSIGDKAFFKCTALTSIKIPDSVTSIGNAIFFDCTALTSVTLGNRVTSIGMGAFGSCEKLTSIKLPASVTSIGDSAFLECTSLTSVTLGNSVTSIGMGAFGRCKSLTSVKLPDSVTSIGDSAFLDCTALISVTLGNSVTSIGMGAFGGCKSLTSVTIPDSVTKIGDSAFLECTALTSVTLGNSVTTIGKSTFEKCKSLTSIKLPDSVTTIGFSVFSGCSSLANVTIGNNVTYIESGAFGNCEKLTSITIPSSVTNIKASAFILCTNLVSVTFEDINGWYYAEIGSSDYKNINVADSIENAKKLTDPSLCMYRWIKK